MAEEKYKYCAQCEMKCRANEFYCSNCGSRKFIVAPGTDIPDNTRKSNVDTSVSQSAGAAPKISEDGFNNTFEGFTPDQGYRAKRRRGRLITLAVIASLIMLSVVFMFVFYQSGEQDDKGDISDIEYNKGELKDNVYLNEWCNLKIEIPDGWREANWETYIELDGSSNKVDCGLALQSDRGIGLFLVVFEDGGYYHISESKLLDYAEDKLKENKLMIVKEDTIERGDATIAGAKYETLTATVTSSNNKDVSGCIRYYLRAKGKRIIMIMMVGENEKHVDKTAKSISAFD